MGLQMKRAMEIVRKTSPYVLYRAAIYGALCLGVIVYLLLLAIIGAVFGAGAFWALLVISVALAWLLDVGSFIGEYVFYRQKAGHIALIAEIITEGQLPIDFPDEMGAGPRAALLRRHGAAAGNPPAASRHPPGREPHAV
jgi:hypothetical protein